MSALMADRGENPVPFGTDTPLPLRPTDFDAGIAELLHLALRGAPAAELLNGLCRNLAQLMRLRLAVLVRRLDSGALALEATSAENGLWLELQRISERWDSGVTSLGPAGSALRAGTAVQMGAGTEGFALWRTAADAEHAREILAIPLTAAGETRVLELYFDGDIARGATATLTVAHLSARLQDFFTDLATLRRQRLLAQALESAGNGALLTDIEGTIVWSNAAFSALTGYAPQEVVGRNPSLLKSGHQGVRYYRDLWSTLRAGKVWRGETVDRAKDGSHYAIHQTVSPVGVDGRVTHYLSLHHDIGREREERRELEIATRQEPHTGLLTAAAFDDAAQAALARADDRARTFVVVSLRGARRALPALGGEIEQALARNLGRRVAEFIAAGELAGRLAPFEYGLLLRGAPDATARARLQVLAESLSQPLPWVGDLPELDVHFGVVAAPGEGRTPHELRLLAERRLADEPFPRARRELHDLGNP